MTNTKKNLSITLLGNFKDTGIRFSAMHQAHKTGVFGFARYREDYSVYMEVEGTEQQVEAFKNWCLEIMKRCDHPEVQFSDGKLKGYTEFTITD